MGLLSERHLLTGFCPWHFWTCGRSKLRRNCVYSRPKGNSLEHQILYRCCLLPWRWSSYLGFHLITIEKCHIFWKNRLFLEALEELIWPCYLVYWISIFLYWQWSWKLLKRILQSIRSIYLHQDLDQPGERIRHL